MRWLPVLIVCFFAFGCERTYSYLYSEVIHAPGQLKVGDTVAVETSDGVSIRGLLTRVSSEELVITTESDDRRRVPWSAIRTIYRVEKVRVKSG